MPYVVPSVEQFQARFPIFSDKDTGVIQSLLNEAAGKVDQSWSEGDYQPAIMYLTAHLLATDNSDEGGEVEVGPEGANVVASESFAGMSVSYAIGATGAGLSASSAYGATVYGRRFLQLLKLNKPAVVIIS